MDFDKYKNTDPYPFKAAYTTVYWYKGGECVNSYLESAPNYLDEKARGALSSKEIDQEAYKAACAAHNKRTGELMSLFQTDLFEALGIADNPKRFKLFSIAWEHGHANGFSDVYYYADELVPLIKD